MAVFYVMKSPLLLPDPGPLSQGLEPLESMAAKMTGLAEVFDGRVGIYVRHLKTGEEFRVSADSLFPTASMVKIPIMLATFAAIERGELPYHGVQIYRDSLLDPGDDLLGSFSDGEEILLSKLVLLMLTMSDNTASLWLQQLAGGGEAINSWLDEAGFTATRMNTRTEGRRPDWERFGWGQTSPREMAELVVAIRRGRAVSPAASQEMYRALTRTFWDDEAISELPPWVQAASKQGAVTNSKSEVVLVNAPSGDYVFCVITDEQSDTWWVPDNAGFVLIRTVSRLLWAHFEPDHPWIPERTGVYQAP
ncbi:MAG: beta-lactamase class A [Rhodothermales bacterium]|jgi:beta-lactamase class A